jgi:hypothetical protein
MLWVLGHAAHAELIDCGAIAANPAPYKVVLDDFFIVAPAAETDLTTLMERLNFSLRNQLNLLQQEIGSTIQVRLVPCKGRRPADDSDFTRPRAATLNSQRVVLEFWGVVDRVKPATGPARKEAWVRYVIMPLQDYNYGDANVPAFQDARYPRGALGADASDDQLLQNLPELTIYTLIGIGTKARYAKEYARATTALRKAEALVTDLRAQSDRPELKSLFDYIHAAVCETAAAAKNDAPHAGVVALIPVENCHAPH